MSTSTANLSDGIVLLNALALDDVAVHLAGEDEEHAKRFGWYPKRSTEETVRSAILQWQENWATGGQIRTFGVRYAVTGELVGGCEIRLKDNGTAHMSYWTFPLHRGRGFASRALRLACDWAFVELGVERTELHIEPDNVASRKVATNAGFSDGGVLREQEVICGERRDMALYTRLPDNPRSAV